MEQFLIMLMVFTLNSCSKKLDQMITPATDKPYVPPVYTFETTPVWADEFNTAGKPDAAKWGYDVGGSGWGNNELQYYTEGENADIANGILTITAKREPKVNKSYSSVRMVTKGKGDFLYGRFEIRAKLPSGRGTWPAIWMLPTDFAYGGWPKSGEIDIMEHVGYDPKRVHITVHTEAFNHTKNTQVGQSKIIETAMTDFHKYRVDWTPDYIKGYIDDEQVFEFLKRSDDATLWPFNKRFHLLLNIAIGGNWGGAQGVDDGIFPAKMDVDYVRVYKLNP